MGDRDDGPWRPVATVAQMRALDAALEAELGLDGVALMEIAGAGCFLLMRDIVEEYGRVIVAAGPGQNGGDGFVVARYARAAGFPVEVHAMRAPRVGTAAAVHLKRLEACDVPVTFGDLKALEEATEPDDSLVVDALFGTGLVDPVGLDVLAWIGAVNGAAAIVSIDVPSGLDGDSGAIPGGKCVMAVATIAIGALKAGLLTTGGALVAGELDWVPLPYPPRLWARVVGRPHGS